MNDFSFDFKPSSDESEVVARIINGKNKGENIYLNNQTQTEIENDRLDLLYDYLTAHKYRLTQKKIDNLANAVLIRDPDDLQSETKSIYDKFMKSINESHEISLPESEIQIVPYQGSEENIQRDCLFIAACSGAGKTTFISQYCQLFNKLYTRSKIYLFSSKPINDEKAFSSIKHIQQVPMDDDSLDDIITNKGNYLHFADKSGQSLVIFDDYDAIPKKTGEKIDVILNSILQTGRSKRIYCIVSKHVLNSGNKTKIVWSECNKIVLFPNGLSRYSLIYAMKYYIGLDMKVIEKLLSSHSRWVTINNHMPKYYITQNSLSFIK